jgi:hypothetical protein
VVKLLVGDAPGETLFLANSSRIRHGSLGAGEADPAWHTRGRISVWNRLKQGIAIDWYEVRPARGSYRSGEAIRYRLVPIRASGWSHEAVVGSRIRRLAVRVRYGRHVICSAEYLTEAWVSRMPWIGPRADTGVVGRMAAFSGSLPYRPGSSTAQVLAAVAADGPSWVAAGLVELGYRSPEEPSWAQLESSATVLLRGYMRLGQLLDTEGRPVRLVGERCLRRNDVVVFGASHRAGFVMDGHPRPGIRLSGVPASLPLIVAGPGLAGPRTFAALALELPYLFRRQPVKILRFEPRAATVDPRQHTSPARRIRQQ